LSFLLQFQFPLLSLHKLKHLPSGPDTLSPTPPYEVPLPLGGYRAPVWPVAKLSKLPTGLGLEYALKCVFECFSGLVCVSLCLACENFVGHLAHLLLVMRSKPLPESSPRQVERYSG
jgi:hypothetical protein